MPPKKKANSQQQKKVQKTVEDKTFGMKNKNKSKKVQSYVKQVEQQAQYQGKQKKSFMEQPKMSKKEQEAQKQAERAELFRPLTEKQKDVAGVDPKTVLCNFFAQGKCTKGNRCRYSHDLGVVRKVSKIDMYTDGRKEDDKKDQTMEKWSQDELEDVVKQKQGKNVNSTDIVCKYFLEAIESAKYGWFWECPNGGENCKYRHALPPGFMLRAPGEGRNGAQDDDDAPTLEELLDEERRLLKERLAETGGGTAVTLERFLEWRERRKAMKQEEKKKEEAAKAKGMSKAERDHRKLMSGREMFVFKPDLFVDDDAAGDDIDYRIADSDDEEINELEATGTSLTRKVVRGGKDEEEEQDAEEDKEEKKEEEKKGVPIDEDLFADDAGDLSEGDLE